MPPCSTSAFPRICTLHELGNRQDPHGPTAARSLLEPCRTSWISQAVPAMGRWMPPILRGRKTGRLTTLALKESGSATAWTERGSPVGRNARDACRGTATKRLAHELATESVSDATRRGQDRIRRHPGDRADEPGNAACVASGRRGPVGAACWILARRMKLSEIRASERILILTYVTLDVC